MHTHGETSGLLSRYADSPLSVGSSVSALQASHAPPRPSSPLHSPLHLTQHVPTGVASDAAPLGVVSPSRGLASASLNTASPWRGEMERPNIAFEHISNGCPRQGSPLPTQKWQMASLSEGNALSASPAVPLTLRYASSPGTGGGDFTRMHLGEAGNSSASREVSCHFALVKARRIVSFFRRQLQSVLESSERFSADATVLQTISDMAEALDVEVGSAASAAGADEDPCILPDGVSNPVSRSLTLANSARSPVHRSTSVSSDVMAAELKQQARANEELLVALNAMKDSNRELKDQVCKQSDEIASLTRFRKVDADRMEDLERTHRLEESLREKDFRRRLVAAEEAADTRCQDVRRAFQQRLREQCSRLDQVRRDCGQLRVDHASQKRAVQALSEALQQSYASIETDIVNRIEAFAKRQLRLLATSDSMSISRAEELEVSLAEERDLRLSEASSWSHRHALLSAERDDLQARLVVDLGQFESQWRLAESRLEAERREWAQERSGLLEEYAREKQRCADGEAALRRVRCDSVERETAQEAALEEERQTRLEISTELAELQRRLSSVEGELAVATTARESLREQLENQRQDLVDAGERSVQVCRDDYERQLATIGENSKAAADSLKENLQAAETRVSDTEEEVKQMRAQAAAAAESLRALREELSNAKGEAAHATGALQAIEGELSNIRQELSQERANSKARVEQMELEKAGLQENARRAQVDTDDRCTQLAEALQAGLRERDLQIEACEQRCMGARETAADATAEVKYQSQRIVDIQAALDKSEKDSASQAKLWGEDRRRLEEALESEAAALWQNQEQYTHWRESHLSSLQQTQALLKTFSEAQVQAISKTQEESLLQAASRERDRRLCKAEMATSEQKLADLEAELGAAEIEGSNVRNLLNESQSTLSVIQVERQRDEQQAAAVKELLQQRLKEATAAAENANKREVALARELDEAATNHKEERIRLEKELSELRQHDADTLIAKERLHAGFEARVHALEARQKTELQLEKLGVETVLRENEQLRRTIAAQRQQATSGVDSLQAQLETHIAQLQKQTSEFCLESPHRHKTNSRISSPYKSPLGSTIHGLLPPGASSPLSLGPAIACMSASNETPY
mmetsp:Transcript_117085/g.185239  ORF Transcript_117085/g.185239 Transcript_117085/m.185239 type:complete len:1114 (+) Transcript_117085:86-3427(+)